VWGLTFLLGHYAHARFYHSHFPLVLLFFVLSSSAIHAGVLASLNENPKRFPAYFMGITGLKLMVYLISISIYVVIYKEAGIPVLLLFLMLYVLFTALELFSLLPKVKSSPKDTTLKNR
jgi:uncharacterized membrane protein